MVCYALVPRMCSVLAAHVSLNVSLHGERHQLTRRVSSTSRRIVGGRSQMFSAHDNLSCDSGLAGYVFLLENLSLSVLFCSRPGPAAHTTRTACCHWQVSWCVAGDMNAQLASTIRRLAGACCSHASYRRMPRAVVTQHASRAVTRGFASAGTGAPSDSGAHQPPLVVMYVSASVCRLSFLLALTEPLGACRQ